MRRRTKWLLGIAAEALLSFLYLVLTKGLSWRLWLAFHVAVVALLYVRDRDELTA